MFLIKEFDHLKIQLEDIISATDNFGPSKLIGNGGFGTVYKGELSLPQGRSMVAFKRLDRKFGQGNTEFWKEIMMLSKCKHQNLVSLIHFCFEGDERILVYEYASRGSLDRHLGDASLTWMQRLKICLGVARGLHYLHDPVKTKQRVLHRDIKSSNILLDEKWNAKLSDFGLSKVGPANQPQTYLVTNVVGTIGYCDPLYFETGLLSKESDVYSFGVVLFEMMCGKLCYEYRNVELARILVGMWKKCFDENRLEDIICHGLMGQIDGDSLMTFSTIANRCLSRDHKNRPTMVEIIKELKVAVKLHRLAVGRKEASYNKMFGFRRSRSMQNMSPPSKSEPNQLHQEINKISWWSLLETPSSGSKNLDEIYVHPMIKKSTSSASSTMRLEMCTESLGSERGNHIISESSDAFCSISSDDEGERVPPIQRLTYKITDRRVRRAGFPPPLTTIRGSEDGTIKVKHHREGGRLVLKAITEQGLIQNFFKATTPFDYKRHI